MLAKETVLKLVKSGEMRSRALDGRDFSRLCDFFEPSEWPLFGCELKEGETADPVQEWTSENITARLARDLAFAWEKAIDERGISSSCMYEVVKMWLAILEDPLKDHDEYAMYGKPLYRKVSEKYGLPNPE